MANPQKIASLSYSLLEHFDQKNAHRGWVENIAFDMQCIADAITGKYKIAPGIFGPEKEVEGIVNGKKEKYLSQRRKDNFLFADLIIIDVDDGATLAEAAHRLRNHAHVIATTKSHQIAKGKKPACDRYRVILPLAKRCIDELEFCATSRACAKGLNGDTAPAHGAGYFNPCQEVYSMNPDGKLIEVRQPPAPPKKPSKTRKMRRIPPKIADFVYRGIVFDEGRQRSMYMSALILAKGGARPDQIRSFLLSGNYSREGLIPGELERAIENGILTARGN
jgi:hypothetical protein